MLFCSSGRLAALYSQRVFDSVFSFPALSQQKVSEFHLEALPSPRVTSRTAELVFMRFWNVSILLKSTHSSVGKFLGPVRVRGSCALWRCRTSEPALSCQLDLSTSHKVASFPCALSYLHCYNPAEALSRKRPDRFSRPPSLPSNRYLGEGEGVFPREWGVGAWKWSVMSVWCQR
jgi:hypothetical protein